ncbi:MAG: Pathosis-related transcriptional factor and protein [Bacilli bacterium]|nr:Pathosis-related transcriptional factor and protein [Bacilli bacterium]
MKNKYEIRGDVTAIFLNSPTHGAMETLIDTVDLEKIINLNYTWHACPNANGQCYYVFTNILINGKRVKTGLHRWLMDLPEGLIVDHINGDTLNNLRSSNLRSTTVQANTQNRHIAKVNGTSGVRGVYWHKQSKRWIAKLSINKIVTYLGCFEDLKEAERVVKEGRAKYMPNSPEWREKHAT